MTVLDSQDDISNDVGWIYVMSNQAFPELLKVGYTLGDPKDRVRELSSSTAVPHPFEIDFLFVCENPQEVEQKVHRRLHAHRVNPQREFFRTSSDLLQTTILSVIYDADFSAAEGDIYLIGAAMVVEAFRVMVRHPDRFKQVDRAKTGWCVRSVFACHCNGTHHAVPFAALFKPRAFHCD